MKRCLSYDDVLIIPSRSDIESRSMPNTSAEFCGINLKIPLISSPMDTVTDGSFANELNRLGGIGIVHRFMSNSDQASEVLQIEDTRKRSFAVGVGDKEFDRLNYICDAIGEENLGFVNIDVANGFSTLCKNMISNIKNRYPNLKVIAGSVATEDGYRYLADNGADAVRVGIGGGSICKTRIMTGIGLPTFHSILECNKARRDKHFYTKVPIIADGGIRYPSDVVKALVAGADLVMCGKIFAETEESCGYHFVGEDGESYKFYRGMASKEVQVEKRGGLKEGTCAEGVQTVLKIKGSLSDILSEYSGGLKSAMTYVNALDLEELRRFSKFIEITRSGIDESHAFGTKYN